MRKPHKIFQLEFVAICLIYVKRSEMYHFAQNK